MCTHLVNGGVSSFGTIIIRSFGYTPLKSILMLGCVRVGVLGSGLLSGIISVYVKNSRIYLAIAASAPVIVGSSLIWRLDWDSHAGPVTGFCMLGFFAVSYVMILALANANTAGHTKKAVTAGMIWAIYCISNGVVALLVLSDEAYEHYPTQFATIISVMGLNAVLAIGRRFYLARDNKWRDALQAGERRDLDSMAYADLTDRENPNFRYCL